MHFRTARSWLGRMAVCAALVLAVVATSGGTAAALPEPPSGVTGTNPLPGWFPADQVRSPNNPLFTYRAQPGTTRTDRGGTLTAMRVDDKLADPLGRYYLWSWSHGLYPRTATNGGRMSLLTADSLAGPWTDRGEVTPADGSPPGWGPYSWTGGDVVWSDKYQQFFSFPHAHGGADNTPGGFGLDNFAMSSSDGIHWTRLSDQPVLLAGPEGYDAFEVGYGRIIRAPSSRPGEEKWIWLYRGAFMCGDCSSSNNGAYYTFSVATADDIHGPWTKAPDNPVFDPYAGGTVGKGGQLIGINAFFYYDGYYQLIWQHSFGGQQLSRSKDLRQWEDLGLFGAAGQAPFGQHNSGPFFQGAGPNEVVIVSANVIYDDDAKAWALIYTGFDAAQFAGSSTAPGTASINIARSVLGGHAPNRRPVADAGPDQSVPATSDAGSQVALDASRSADPDGDALSYRWDGPFGTVYGPFPTVALPLGRSTVTLTVSDGYLDSSPDAVTVEVMPVPTELAYAGAGSARGEQVEVVAVLTDDEGAPAVGRSVTFTAGEASATAVTDAAGRAATTLDLPDHGRSQTVTASFAGDGRYQSSSTSAVVTWGATP